MSASRERKKRVEMEQQLTAAPQQAKKKSRLSEGWIFAIVVVLIVAALFAFVLGRGVYQRNRTVLTVGEHDVSVKEFNYFYSSIANNYLTYATYFGTYYSVDASVPMDEAYVTDSHLTLLSLISTYDSSFAVDTDYLEGHTAEDGVYDVTLAQLFANTAKQQAISCYLVYDEAVANGFTLDDDCKAEIDESIQSLKDNYKEQYGWSLSATIRNLYGDGCNKSNYRDYLELTHTASHYLEQKTFSDAEIAARYEEEPETFNVASFWCYQVCADDFVEADEDGNKADPTDAEEAKAKAAAEEMEKNFVTDDADKTVTMITDRTSSTVTSSYSEEIAAWVFDETTEVGSVKMFEKDGEYYVIQLLSNADYQLPEMLQIYVPNDAEDAELAEGELSAEDKLAAINAGLESDASEASFRNLAEKYTSEGADIEISNMNYYSLSSTSKEACLWIMEGAQAGSYKSFEISSGTIYLFITNYSKTYTSASVNNTLAAEWLEESVAATELVCNYSEEAAMCGHVGLYYSAS